MRKLIHYICSVCLVVCFLSARNAQAGILSDFSEKLNSYSYTEPSDSSELEDIKEDVTHSTFTYSDIQNLNDKSDDELWEIYLSIEAILLARNDMNDIHLHAGNYTVGDDFPSGVYRLECSGAYSSSVVKVFENKESSFPSENYIMAEMYNSSIIGKIELVDGNYVTITGSEVIVSAYEAPHIEADSSTSASFTNDKHDATDLSSRVVSSGKYKIGDDIPAGIFRIVCEEPYGFASVSVYKNGKTTIPSYSTILSDMFGNAEIGKIELTSGEYIEIAEGSVTFYPYEGIG